MKKHICIILSLLLPLLFTSCLADYLNEKFGYTPPIYVSYKSQYGDVPGRKLIEKGGALTSDYLPTMYYSGNEFEGWYMDDNFNELAQEGYIVNQSLTLYAKWKYGDSRYQTPKYSYEVHFCFFDADNSSRGFEYRSEYTQTFDSREVAESFSYSFAGYEYIPGADATYSSYDSYTDGQLTKQITIIEKRYYKTHIYADGFKETGYYLSQYSDYTFTFYLMDYAPDLLNLVTGRTPPTTYLHLENCNGLTEIPSSAFANMTWLKEIYLPSSIGKIDSMAFAFCTNLRYIQMEYGITELGVSSFKQCSSLETIYIPDSVTSLGNYNFSSCSSLSYISLPEFITEIPANCFEYCSSLESIKIPKHTDKILTYAFMNCSSLKSVYLPSSLTKINSEAFKNCSVLTDVYYEGGAIPTNLTINDSTINGIKGTDNWHWNGY